MTGVHKSRETKFCTTVCNVCWSSVWKCLSVTLPEPTSHTFGRSVHTRRGTFCSLYNKRRDWRLRTRKQVPKSWHSWWKKNDQLKCNKKGPKTTCTFSGGENGVGRCKGKWTDQVSLSGMSFQAPNTCPGRATSAHLYILFESVHFSPWSYHTQLNSLIFIS